MTHNGSTMIRSQHRSSWLADCLPKASLQFSESEPHHPKWQPSFQGIEELTATFITQREEGHSALYRACLPDTRSFLRHHVAPPCCIPPSRRHPCFQRDRGRLAARTHLTSRAP